MYSQIHLNTRVGMTPTPAKLHRYDASRPLPAMQKITAVNPADEDAVLTLADLETLLMATTHNQGAVRR